MTGQLDLISGLKHAIQLVDVAYINIEGFHLRPQNPAVGRWVFMQNASHITVRDCLMEGSRGGSWSRETPFMIESSQYIKLLDSIVRDHQGDNMINVYRSHHLLFEGNAIGYTGHSPLALSPSPANWGSNSHIVVRGNVFYAGWGRALEFFTEAFVVFEGNTITHSYHGGHSAGAESKMQFRNGIFRFNRIVRNWGGGPAPVVVSPYSQPDQAMPMSATHMRMYHNVFADNYWPPLRISTGGGGIKDIELKNTIFSGNDQAGGNRQFGFSGNAGEVRFVGNVIDGLVQHQEFSLALASFQSPDWEKIRGRQFVANLATEPGFVDPVNGNYALLPASPLRDAAQPLTYAVGNGEGRVLPVEDARYFYDGFGIAGEVGDLIAVGTAAQQARVVQVDLEKQLLTLDRDVQWRAGDAIGLAWSGAAADVGVYEHGNTGRVSVQVVVEPFVARTGEPVRLRAVVHGGVEPVSYRWQLGDGTVAYGPEVEHRYPAVKSPTNSPYGFPVTLRVTAADGQSYVGTGLVEIEEPRKLERPVFHTTFDADDEDWWWIWYKNRPTPVEWERVLDSATGEGVLRIANPGGGSLPLHTNPAQWNLDQFPLVYLRYRVAPGTPVALYLEALPDAKGSRRVYVAQSPAVAKTKQLAKANGDALLYSLIDDNQWHDLLVDARLIQRVYPEVQLVYRLGFENPTPNTGRKGEAYWLDEAAILPQSLMSDPLWAQKLAGRQTWHLAVKAPQAGQSLSGTAKPDVAAITYEPSVDGFTRCVIEIDGAVVYDGEALPPAGSVAIDTLQLPDGEHRLDVAVTDQRGQTQKDSVLFWVRNWDTFTDEMEPPFVEMGFFGMVDQRRTVAQSQGWQFAQPVAGIPDETRWVRTANTPEYLVWETPSVRRFSVTLFAQSELNDNVVELAVSADGKSWTAVPYQAEVVETNGAWHKVVLAGDVSFDGAAFFRLAVRDYMPAEGLQVAKVAFQIRSRR